MSEAPKKIWVPEVWVDCLGWEEAPGEEIPYIRADIVDELVEALKGATDAMTAFAELNRDTAKAKAVLAKLENNSVREETPD